MKKWKSVKHSSLLKSFTERTKFLKMQNFPSLESNIISTAGKNKRCKQDFTKDLDFLVYFYVICMVRITFEVRIWKKYIHQVSLETICLLKNIWVPLFSWYWCRRYGETLDFPSKICRLMGLYRCIMLHKPWA